MNNKLNKLKKLNKTLKSPPQELGGKFLPENSPKQYYFMFIAEMPSMKIPKCWDKKSNYNFGEFNARCKFFQEMIIKYNVAGSYATDIVKERDVPGKPKKEAIKQWLPFLLKEIKIIQPKAIIVLGERTYIKSFRPFIEPLIPKKIKVDYVFHYSSQVPRNKFEQRFSKVINKMRNKKDLTKI